MADHEEYLMKILIAEDDPVSRKLLESYLTKWGYEVAATSDGNAAWDVLAGTDPPLLAILDWMMPGHDGIELCRKIREDHQLDSAYIILLTAKGQKEDVITGLEAGADDYVVKPFYPEELRARIEVGVRVIQLQTSLENKVHELELAIAKVKRLHGLLPICSYCKKVRDDNNYWQQIEGYISEHSEAEFSHGICPDCYAKHIVPELKKGQSEG